MDWETLLKAYPTQTDIILGVRYLRERVENAMAGVDAPKLDGPCRAMDDLGDFVPVIAPACTLAWKDITGASPSFDMAEALKALAVEGDTPEMAQADRERLEAIAQNAFSRLLNLLREKNPHLIPREWNQGDCPFCGSYARIGFDEEDRRTLHCLSCGHSWRFPRLRCPSCGNTDHTTLGYFEAEGIEGVRVHFCRECSRYLKVVDRKVRSAHDAETDDALTLELDELAKKEQFS